MLILSEIILAGLIASLTAGFAFWALGMLTPQRTDNLPSEVVPEPIALLFDKGVLHHATETAMRRLQLTVGAHDWDDLVETLCTRFPDIPRMAFNGSSGTQTFDAIDGFDSEQVNIRWRGDLCWVSLISSEPDHPLSPTQRLALGHLERVTKSNPNPAWAEDDTGAILWQNPAYSAIHKRLGGAAKGPFARFDPNGKSARYAVAIPDEDMTEHFEIQTTQNESVTYYHANRITALHKAEEAKRNFVQTLSKTFAHLPTGLAIFDKNGQLALFNPALVDLSGLSPVFLAGQPTMISFFDQLREHRRMPEPKNYATWREEIANMIAAAADGRYQETWNLDGGQTFSVQGRPHPDGATAFMIEDISAEVMLTRNFRAELELGQALFDSFDEALVVFSPSGVLTFNNDAYRRMWDQNPDSAFADVTIADAIHAWQTMTTQDAPWPEIADFVSGATHHQRREVHLPMKDGQILRCRMIAIATGARLIRFDPCPVDETTLERTKQITDA